MEALIKWLDEYYAPFAARVGDQRHLKAIRDGVVSLIPLLLIGSFFLIIAFPPISSLAKLVEPYVPILVSVNNTTMGLMGLMAAFAVAYSLAASYKMDTLSSSMFSVAAFMLATPFTKDGNIAAAWMGSKGLFVAMLSAIFIVELQRFMIKRNIVIRMPDGVPPTVARSFVALIPGFIALALILILNISLFSLGSNVQDIIYKILAAPLLSLGSSLPAFLLAAVFAQLLWTVGIHGASLVGGIMSPVWYSLSQQNAVAKAAGEVPPNIICQQFWEMFSTIGGSGSTFALAIMLLTIVKSKQLKAIGKSAIWPGLFNINEPIIFGLPIVMNPIMMIPFVLAPVVSITIAYFVTDLGLADKAFAMAPWTTPPFINAFLDTGDIRTAVLQFVCFLVTGIIYYPFLRMADMVNCREEGISEVVYEEKQIAILEEKQ